MSQHHSLKSFCFFQCVFVISYQNSVEYACGTCVWFFNFITMMNVLFLCQFHSIFLYLCSITWNQKWWELQQFFIVQEIFWCPYFFFVWSWVIFICLWRIGLKLFWWVLHSIYRHFGRIALFTMLILLIQNHGRSFELLMLSLIFFFKHLKFYHTNLFL